MSSLKTPENNGVRNRRIPNAFLLFVKEQKTHFLQNCADEDKSSIAALLGRKWRSMSIEEKQIYFDKHKALKNLKDDKLDSNGITEDEELSLDSYTNEEEMVADHATSKLANKSTTHGLDEETAEMCPINLSTLPEIDTLSSCLVSKEKPLRKPRRPLNAFMIFANEQRRILDLSIIKEQKCHVNTVLGGMWRDLPDSEKAKYLTEARQLLKSHKKSEATLSNKIPKKKKSVQFKLPKKTVDRLSMKKKRCLSKTTPSLRSFEASEIKKSEIESNLSKPAVDKNENSGNTRSSPETHVTVEYPIGPSSQQHNTTSQIRFHPMVSSTEPHHSKHCCYRSSFSPDCSSNNFNQYLSSNAGMHRPCFGGGFFPSMFPSYPFSTPFWMYQQSMPPPMFPFPSFGFPPSICGFSSPYSYNSAYSNVYGSCYAGGVIGPFSDGISPGSSATVTKANIKEESSTEVTQIPENSEDELLVVDEASRDGEQS